MTKNMLRRLYFNGRWWLVGVQVTDTTVTHASLPDGGRRYYSCTRRSR